MAKIDPTRLSALEAVEACREGSTSIVELAQALLDRVSARGNVQAFVHLPYKQIISKAIQLQEAPSKQKKSKIYGCAIAVKDLFYTEDMPTRLGSPRYVNDLTMYDASVVSVLRKNGLLIFGKTVTTEFAFTMHGKATLNPHDFAYSPGGSSSGSAAAVADYQVPLAIGTQTYGSIIRPASYCGIYGYKPTWGCIPTAGVKSLAPTLDTVGFFARKVENLQALTEMFEIQDFRPSEFKSLKGARIAWCKTPAWGNATLGATEVLAKAVKILKKHGAEVEELVPPFEPFSRAPVWHSRIATKELATNMVNELLSGTTDLDPMLMKFVKMGQSTTSAQYKEAIDGFAQMRIEFDELAEGLDAVMTLSATGEAPKGQEYTGDSSFNTMWTALHTPCISVPGMGGENGMPVGIQLIAPRWRDKHLLMVAKEVGKVLEVDGNWSSML